MNNCRLEHTATHHHDCAYDASVFRLHNNTDFVSLLETLNNYSTDNDFFLQQIDILNCWYLYIEHRDTIDLDMDELTTFLTIQYNVVAEGISTIHPFYSNH